MGDLIYSRKANNSFLTNEEIQQRAPAVFAHGAANDLSAKYGNFDSTTAIAVMAENNYFPVQAAQIKSRNVKSLKYGQHLLAFAKNDPVSLAEQPEIVFYNSHDGGSSMRLFAGMYRFICSNGIVAGDGFDQRLVHYQSNVSSFEKMVASTADSLEGLSEITAEMKSKTLSGAAQAEFAEAALATRFDSFRDFGAVYSMEDGKRERSVFTAATVQQALRPRRDGDLGADAWTVFNRVQEAVLRGGDHFNPLRVIGDSTRRSRKIRTTKNVRPLKSIRSHVETNRALWDIGQNMLMAA